MVEYMRTWLDLRADRRAVTALEYGLIAAAIAAVIAATVFTLGGQINNMFNNIAQSL
ncbi:MAG TPA: Flp family type IVb pilin [Acetobacteraceae bacterium]|nr:Flp family type IVb pilin [Acetobacteraceae bacterium]